MNDEVLLENKALRTLAIEQVDPKEVLNKIKGLILLPDDVHETIEMVADYFGVQEEVIKWHTREHRDELEPDGLKVLRGKELEEFAGKINSLANAVIISPKVRSLTLFTPRAHLRLGMLLRDSQVAKALRTALLDLVGLAKNESPDVLRKLFGDASGIKDGNLEDLRLTIQRMNAEARLRHAKAQELKVLQKVLDRHAEVLSPAARQAVVAYMTNAVAEREIIPLPTVEKQYTATEIAAELGVSPQFVGRVSERRGLKIPEHGIWVLDKSPNSDKQVTAFRYNERGRKALIKAVLEETGRENK